MGVSLGDYQHKGRFSLAITHFSDEYAALFRNDGALAFTDVSYESGIGRSSTPYVGWVVAFLDIDNDGWANLIIANGHVYPQVDAREIGTKYRDAKLVFFNQRDGTFRDISKFAEAAIQVPQVSRGLAAADVFNDGHMEIVVENLEGGPMILRVKSGTNHWVSLTLEGTKSNRLALNARVRAACGDVVQEAEVLSGGSYLSQSDLRLHFGLGRCTSVDKLEIRWPSGKVETLTHLAADHFHKYREGDGTVASIEIRR